MTLEKLASIIMEFKQDIDNKFDNLKEYVDNGFKEINSRIDKIENRLDMIENRLNKLEMCPTIFHELKQLN